jgi:hypothetical protein
LSAFEYAIRLNPKNASAYRYFVDGGQGGS